jgi:hypothetical protein
MPGPFYRPRYGADLELACLDASRDTEQEEIHRYLQAPKHQQWLRSTFGRRGDRWLIPYSHHLVYSAGPNHQNDHTQLLGAVASEVALRGLEWLFSRRFAALACLLQINCG